MSIDLCEKSDYNNIQKDEVRFLSVTENKENYANKLSSNKRNRLKKIEIINEYKTKCAKCGESRKYTLDWHHINSNTKGFTLCQGIKGKGLKTILLELDNCVCLCRNCHAEFHYLYGQQVTEKELNEYLQA